MNEDNNNERNLEIVNENIISSPALTDMTDDIIASAERRIAKMAKIKELSLKSTNINDWIDQQGKPYLCASGAEKVARLFGISWKILATDKIISNDEKENFYFYRVTGIFTMLKDSIHAIGTCSSRDAFFALHTVTDQKTGQKTKEYKSTSQIDETNIMKSAYTNCLVNGVTRLLGIRNLTWEQVEYFAQFKRTEVSKVSYSNGGAGGGKISEAQAKRLFVLNSKGKKTQAQLQSYIKDKYEIDQIPDIDRKDYEAICKWAETITTNENQNNGRVKDEYGIEF